MRVDEILERNGRIYPNDIALIELTPSKNLRKTVTWKELDARASKIANALTGFGVKEGERILHWQRNSIHWIETFFGIVKTGAWVVPLNYRFTMEDFRYCADITEARIIIADENLLDKVCSRSDGHELTKIVVGTSRKEGVEKIEELIKNTSTKPPKLKTDEEAGCALYFTSGTTGDPKPILHSHRAFSWTGAVGVSNFSLRFDDNFIIIPPLYHLGAFGHWLGHFSIGSRAVILTEFSPKNLFQAVSGESVTVAWLLVPWTQDILTALDKGELKREEFNLTSWRLMYMGAQAIPVSIIKHWKSYFPEMAYDTDYGTSEAILPFDLGMDNPNKIGSIGRPAIGWDAKIVDARGQDVSDGEVGELILKGNAVMKEYYKNPTRTAEKLVEGWSFTGDLARKDADGFFYIAGRKKDVIICGGENVFPEEVENTLQNLPQVEDVAAIGIPDKRLGEIVAAVVQVKKGERLNEEDIMRYCEESLPRYKRPRRIFFSGIPRNQAGKIEKMKLRKQFGSGSKA